MSSATSDGSAGIVPGSVTYTDWPNASSYYYWTTPVEPTTCIGKAHVFECEHVDACKCGAVKRVMPRLKKGKKR